MRWLNFLDFVLLSVLLFKLGGQSFLDVAEVSVLETSKLLKLCGPSWVDVALLPSGTNHCTGDQVLIRVNQLVVL